VSSERKAVIKISLMVGTKSPPGEGRLFKEPPVIWDGKSYSLSRIYSNAGLDIEVNTESQEIPDLMNGRYTQNDLMVMKDEFRPISSPFGINAWLVIVNGILRAPDQNTGVMQDRTDVLGFMFDQDKRTGTAVFYQNQEVRTKPFAYLRTSAHELGHQFNLHHRDAFMHRPTSGGRKYSIMNQTLIIQKYGLQGFENWSAAAELEFGEHERDHLTNHPITKVAPGLSPNDGTCTSDHVAWHQSASTTLGVTNPGDLTPFDVTQPAENVQLDLHIQMGKPEYLPGQPAIAYLKLTNNGSNPVSIIDEFDPQFHVVKFYIKADDKEVEFLPKSLIDFTPEPKVLNPRESTSGRAKIFYGAHGYSFSDPGTYKVRAEYNGLLDYYGKTISSNTIDVIIQSPKNNEEEEQVKLIKGDQQALVFLFEGGEGLTDGMNQ
jgi:hypothetical protein